MSEKKRPSLQDGLFVLQEIVQRMAIFEADTATEQPVFELNTPQDVIDQVMADKEYYPVNGLIQARLALHDLMSALSEYHRLLSALE